METSRKPIVAGQFYPSDFDTCVSEIKQCLAERPLAEPYPPGIVSGIVPHAGWAFSGSLAAMVFAAVKHCRELVDTFIIFGTSHGYFGPPAVYDKGAWKTPLGDIAIDEQLAKIIVKITPAVSDTKAHSYEHSIEVQLPFIKYLFPAAKILPILTPPAAQAVTLGTQIADIIKEAAPSRIICLGSTDLTHYGPHYDFEPMGAGPKAFKWASGVNDRQFIELALNLQADELLKYALKNSSACGPGAAAAAAAVAKRLGKTNGILLAQTNSNEIMLQKMGTTSQDSVGYAAIVF